MFARIDLLTFGPSIPNESINLNRRDKFSNACMISVITLVMTPLHCDFPPRWNIHRKMFNKSLEIAANKHPQMAVLKMLKVWNPDDSALFRDSRYTASGLEAYWSSLDSAFRHWDTFVYTKKKNSGAKPPHQYQRDDWKIRKKPYPTRHASIHENEDQEQVFLAKK